MRIGCFNSPSCEKSQLIRVLQHVKRDDDSDSGESILVVPIVFGLVLVLVFIPLFLFMYRAWRYEKANKLGKQCSVAKEEGDGRFDKAELSCGSSAVIHEMESSQTTQEMPETKEGLSHELPGATVLPQELPADLHEMPDESNDDTKNAANKDI
ncbi:hypothetical protein GGS24DRAFT_478241, partial [Hypoxylon argillaceum]